MESGIKMEMIWKGNGSYLTNRNDIGMEKENYSN